MVVLQSLRKGPNLCWNFIKSGYESATYTFNIFVWFGLPDKAAQIKGEINQSALFTMRYV